MERQIPKNIRQIGNVSDCTKIYIEDYVDTFLNQLSNNANADVIGAFLVGEIVQTEEEFYIYIYGAIRTDRLKVRGKEIFLEDEVWAKACQTCKQFFEHGELLGWFAAGVDLSMEMNHGIQKNHQKHFGKENSLLILKNLREKEEKLYIYKFKNMMECAGYYIYYEKNIEMQNYMIATRRESGMTPSEVVEDQAAKNFRNIVKQKQQYSKEKGKSKLIYMASTFLIIVLVAMGINTINNYERILEMKQNFENNAIQEVLQQENVQAENDQIEDNANVEQKQDADTNGQDVEQENKEDDGDSQITVEESVDVMGEVLTEEDFYIVKKGDTLASISKKIYDSEDHVEAICKMNGLEDGNLIYIGQKLLLP